MITSNSSNKSGLHAVTAKLLGPLVVVVGEQQQQQQGGKVLGEAVVRIVKGCSSGGSEMGKKLLEILGDSNSNNNNDNNPRMKITEQTVNILTACVTATSPPQAKPNKMALLNITSLLDEYTGGFDGDTTSNLKNKIMGLVLLMLKKFGAEMKSGGCFEGLVRIKDCCGGFLKKGVEKILKL